MKKYLYSLFLLLLFTGVAWADSSNPQLYSSAVADKTDLSIAYLSSVFGTVSGVLTGTSGQMLDPSTSSAGTSRKSTVKSWMRLRESHSEPHEQRAKSMLPKNTVPENGTILR